MSTAPYEPPSWARRPKLKHCGLEVYKGKDLLNTIRDPQRKKCTVFGRHGKMSDIRLDHPSISRQHAAILHGGSGNLYVMDLETTHGSFVNLQKLKPYKRQALMDGDIVKFGSSSREYHVRLRLDAGNKDKDDSDSETKSLKKRKREEDDDEEPAKDEKKAKKEKKSKKDDDVGKVSCRHILVKHKDSRRPSSWKSDDITRTKEEAIEKIEKFSKDVKAADDLEKAFMALAKKESDCNSYKRGGDLGKFGKGKMQKPFEEAAFALKEGELSKAVSTLSGVHLIMRY